MTDQDKYMRNWTPEGRRLSAATIFDLCSTSAISGGDPVGPIERFLSAIYDAAREEGRRAGMMEAAQIVRGLQHPMPMNTIQESFFNMARFATNRAADAIEAKANEG